MQEVIFTLRTLTPLFLAGADQTTAELRAPSFRGLMRYWQRALVGGLIGTTSHDIETVKTVETAVFGATDTGSAVSIKVSAISSGPKEFTEQTSVRMGGTRRATGKGYLLWSMAKSGRADRGNLKPARWYFPPGTSFQVTLSARDQNAMRFKQAITAFWLLAHLGGVGSRSRRCAGSLAVQAVQGDTGNLSFNVSKNIQALKLQIEQGIREAKKVIQEVCQLEQRSVKQAQFDILTQGLCRIWILQDEQPWSSAEMAMQRLGENLQSYRSHIAIERRKIFGLPLPPIINKRRASPLLLRVAELQDNKYVGIAVLFKTTGSDVSLGDYKFIEDWINEFHGRQEVTL
ncbi:MAG: type III-B CRISPR module RAMP protein Cmr1 [Ktedonobacteraceae bacterium]|nr:type III-B CRISPR module RAMP protein Cmr1 [Ktedonobacteraceae bacterium]